MMSANDYHLVSTWRVPGTAGEVFEIIADDALLPSWWPAAFLDVLVLDRGKEDGTGGIVRMRTKGYLPYVLNWHLRVNEIDRPNSLAFEVWGDFEGTGRWTLVQNDAWCDITFDWQITLKKGFVSHLSALGRPLFISNHRWAMARGEESLRLELARRRAADETARSSIPPPQGPTRLHPAVPVGIAASLAGLFLLSRRGRKNR